METENPLESLRSVIAFDSRDWSATGKRDAWIYGIVMGWDEGLDEVSKKYGWDEETKNRLIRLNKKFKELKCEDV